MKTLYAIIAFCLVSFTASAQKVTQKEVAGKWKMSGVSREGAMANFETGKMTVTEEWKKANPTKNVADMEAKMMEGNPLATFAVDLTEDGMLSFSMMGEIAQEGPYSLEERDGKTYLAGNPMGGDEVEVQMKDGKMHWVIIGDNMTMIFKRQE